MQNWNLIFGILIISSPILFAMIAFPDSIAWSWNEGRGGYFFALIFVVAELIGLKIVISKKKLFAVIPMALVTIVYLVSLEYGLREYIISSAELFDVQLIYSWTWMWDFVVMAIFIVCQSLISLFNRWIRIAPAGGQTISHCTAMAKILQSFDHHAKTFLITIFAGNIGTIYCSKFHWEKCSKLICSSSKNILDLQFIIKLDQ